MANDKLTGKPADPEASSWLEYVVKLKQDAPSRYEDASKFLVTLISLTTTILLAARDKLALPLFHPIPYLVTLLLWVIALLFAFMVLFPRSYQVSGKEIDAIRDMLDRITRRKRLYFMLSVWLYFVPLAFMACLSVVYFAMM